MPDSPELKRKRLQVMTVLSKVLDPQNKAGVMESPVFEAYDAVMLPLTMEQLETCLSRALQESKWMPRPAELLDLAGCGARALATSQKDELELEAECGWNRLVTSGLDWQHNVLWRPPAMPDAGDYAVRQCGGYEAIFNKILANMDGTEAPDATAVHFVRKNWIDAYCRYSATDGLSALPRAEAQRLLASVKGLLR